MRSGRSEYKQLSNIKKNLDKDAGEVFFDGRAVKLYVEEELEEIVEGSAITKIIRKPHPIYQIVKEIKGDLDDLLDT